MDNQAQNIAHFQDYLGEGSFPLMRGLQLALNLQAELASLPLSKLEEANKPAFTQSLLASLLNIVSSLNDGIHKLSSPPLQLPRQNLPLKKRSYEHVCRRSSSSPARIITKNCTKQAPEKIVKRSLAKFKHKVHAVKDLADGFTWRKYGQKNIQGFTHPRSYYRCIHKGDLNCPALKQVQECDGIASTFDIAYIENHTCCKGACEDQPYGNASKSNSSYGAASCLQIVPTNSCTSSAAVKEETTSLDITKAKWEEVVQDSGFTRSLLCSLMLAEQAENKSSNLPQLAHEQQDQEISCTNIDLPLWDFESFPAFVDFEGQL